MNSVLKIHSKYNPQKEADRFAENINGSPLFIVITEPGEPYLALSLKKKFPEAKLIAIRYSDTEFLSTDGFWDFVWRPHKGSLKFFLINAIPDEYFPATVFLPWKPSENIWRETAESAWKEISETVKIVYSLINTRNHFGKRWCSNIFKNIIHAENNIVFHLDKIEDAFFTASGESLEQFLKTKNFKDFFILSASSALPVLTYNGINPELCISTDGGFWASEHLKNIKQGTPLAFPLEAYIPSNALKNSKSVFLNYGSMIEKYFFHKLNIPFLKTKRNGTVSGTAAELLLDGIKGNIFIAGLDLEYSKGFSHARPNCILQNNFTRELKTNPISNILAHSSFDTRSLNAYAAWFSNLTENKTRRIFRIGSKGAELKDIKRISSSLFFENCKKKKYDCFYSENKFYTDKIVRIKAVSAFLHNMKEALVNGNFIKKIKEFNEESLEKEFCCLVSFSGYLKFVKEFAAGNANPPEENLKQNLFQFIEKEERKIKMIYKDSNAEYIPIRY